jgi:hypothetical protein
MVYTYIYEKLADLLSVPTSYMYRTERLHIAVLIYRSIVHKHLNRKTTIKRKSIAWAPSLHGALKLAKALMYVKLIDQPTVVKLTNLSGSKIPQPARQYQPKSSTQMAGMPTYLTGSGWATSRPVTIVIHDYHTGYFDLATLSSLQDYVARTVAYQKNTQTNQVWDPVHQVRARVYWYL